MAGARLRACSRKKPQAAMAGSSDKGAHRWERMETMRGFLFSIYQRFPDWLKFYLCKLIYKPQLGRKVGIYGNVLFGPNVSIGDYSYIHGPGRLSEVTIGKYCGIARDFSVITSNHAYTSFANYPLFHQMNSPLHGKKVEKDSTHLVDLRDLVIENDVWIGERVTILSGVKIGDGAIVGACSFVNRDIPPYAIAVGVPAKVIRYRFNDEKIGFLEKIRWWDKNRMKYSSI